MTLDDTSLAVGRLQAGVEAVQKDIAELKTCSESTNKKLDRVLARAERSEFRLKHWIILLLAGSAGGGGIAHTLGRIFK